jgi:hypothetical protein
MQEINVGLKIIERYQLLVYADDVNLLGYNIDIIRKNTETLIGASYVPVSSPDEGQNHDMRHSSYIWERQ